MKKPKKATEPLAAAPPDWLNEAARAEWTRVIGAGYRVSGPTDTSALAAYCQNYARWAQAERLLEEHGTEIVIRDDKGNVKSVSVSPQVGIAAKSLASMLKAAEALKLNPAGKFGGRFLCRAGGGAL